MGKGFSEIVRGTSFDESCNISWQGIGIRLNEEVDMIGLNSKLHDLPLVILRDLFNDLLETVSYFPDQNFLPPFWAENDAVEDVVNAMLFVNILLVHVDKYSRYNYACQQFSSPPIAPPEGRAIHPRLRKDGAFWLVRVIVEADMSLNK